VGGVDGVAGALLVGRSHVAVSSVSVAVAWPRASWTAFTEEPAAMSSEA
jgi:hypothetical protein